MTLEDVFNRLNFFINKYTGAWFTPTELEDLCDSGQLALYSDYKPKYATSQLVKDALSPFRATFNFTPADMISGFVIVPPDSDYLDLLDIQIIFNISGRGIGYYPVDLINEDERANRLNSQIDPVTVTSPVGEQFAPRYFMLYPTGNQYTGKVTYFKRPQRPVYGYDLISGRIPVYNPATSTQLLWRDSEITPLILKALQIAGINLEAADLTQFSMAKTEQNWQGTNRL